MVKHSGMIQTTFTTKAIAGRPDGDVLDRPTTRPFDPSKFLPPQTEKKTSLAEPGKYQVILHNDETTVPEFVVAMLQKHFKMAQGEAVTVMRKAHTQGEAAVRVYPREIAETKVDVANQEASSTQHPFYGMHPSIPATYELKFSAQPL